MFFRCFVGNRKMFFTRFAGNRKMRPKTRYPQGQKSLFLSISKNFPLYSPRKFHLLLNMKKSKPSLNRQSKGPDKPAPAAHNGWFWLLLWSFNTNPGFPDRTVSAIPPRPHPRATSANIQIPTSAATAPLRPAPLSPLEVPPNQRRMNNTLSCRMKENRP